MQSIDDLQVMGRRVLLRSDLNVPLDLTGTGQITDDGRIRASLPVISKLSDRGARVIILAHLGRPKGATFDERAAGGPSLRPWPGRSSASTAWPWWANQRASSVQTLWSCSAPWTNTTQGSAGSKALPPV